ncbi:hypothetical protein V5O48_001962 [Marasmius crinis-equi]|uniref:DUF6593 domain-containing protein n=1 Tax=Marasmius crinis-equi TaxID=585013 RepID=A0ABR3FWV2_9AGAR
MKLAVAQDTLNSTYATKDGRAIYKVQTSSRYSGAGKKKTQTKVSKVLPKGIPRNENSPAEGDRFAHLARIEWKHGCSTIHRTGEEINTDSLFVKEGCAGDGLRTHVFADEEGDEYTWTYGSWDQEVSSLCLRFTTGKRMKHLALGGSL